MALFNTAPVAQNDVVLSQQQQDVMDWVMTGKGSLELMARAGCGKTFTILQAARLIYNNGLGDVAIMAYNKKIADEIKVKLAKEGFDWRAVQAGTVHSFGFGAWRKVAPNVVVNGDKVKEICGHLSQLEGGAFYTMNQSVICKIVSLAKQNAFGHCESVDNLSAWLEIWEHFDLDDDIADGVQPERVIEAAQRVYKLSLNQCREVIDFDDMILAPLVFKARFWPKDWVYVDEAQDTNRARRAIAMAMLKPGTGRMVFVGDPAQAIYGFTGANSDSMELLKRETNATTLNLNVTRRCPRLVVEMAAQIVPDFTAHEDAPEGVVRSLQNYEGLYAETLTQDDVILCRNTAPLINCAYDLIARGVACQVEGREIGTGLIKLAQRWKGITTLAALQVKLDDYQDRQTASYMAKGKQAKVAALVDQIDCLRVVISRCLSLNQRSVSDAVAQIKSMFGDTPDGMRPAVLTLSTVHKSKGREWDRVFILGRSTFMPSPYAKLAWQIEQENNLEYVAITRTKRELIDVPARQK